MRTLIVLLALLCSGQMFGQYYIGTTEIDYNKPIESRIDTTQGMIVTVYEGKVLAIHGIKIDSVDVWWSEVPCPDGMRGCLVIHYAKIDNIQSTKYQIRDYVSKVTIPEKNIIKFIPK